MAKKCGKSDMFHFEEDVAETEFLSFEELSDAEATITEVITNTDVTIHLIIEPVLESQQVDQQLGNYGSSASSSAEFDRSFHSDAVEPVSVVVELKGGDDTTPINGPTASNTALGTSEEESNGSVVEVEGRGSSEGDVSNVVPGEHSADVNYASELKTVLELGEPHGFIAQTNGIRSETDENTTSDEMTESNDSPIPFVDLENSGAESTGEFISPTVDARSGSDGAEALESGGKDDLATDQEEGVRKKIAAKYNGMGSVEKTIEVQPRRTLRLREQAHRYNVNTVKCATCKKTFLVEGFGAGPQVCSKKCLN